MAYGWQSHRGRMSSVVTLHFLCALTVLSAFQGFSLPAVLGGRCSSLLQVSEIRLTKVTISEGHPKNLSTLTLERSLLMPTSEEFWGTVKFSITHSDNFFKLLPSFIILYFMCYPKNKVVYSSELADFLHVLMFYDHFRDSSVSYFQPYANVEILFKLTFDLVVSGLNILECL